jgi:putative ABC transport system permease protein
MHRKAQPRASKAWFFLLDADSWYEIWTTLRQNKLRAFLTACGVFWGVFMLIVLLGIGNGLRSGAIRNLGGFVMQTVYVWSQRTTMPHAGFRPGRRVQFTNADVAAITAVPGIEHVAPRVRLGGWRAGVNVSSGAKTSNFNVLGDTPELAAIEPLSFPRGRFINPLDMEQERKVAVIGVQVREFFFAEDEDAIGRYIEVQGVHFQIIGEIKSLKSGDEGDKIASSVFIPFSTFQNVFNQRNKVGWFALTVRSGSSAEDVDRRVRETLAARHRLHPEDVQALGSFNAAEKSAQVLGLFRGIQAFVWFVGVLTLLAGVLGVSNIVLIIVKERTKEIGIRKALGATPRAIVGLIVQESLTLTVLAGYAGLVAGVAVLELMDRAVASLDNAPLNHPEIDLRAALIATLALIVAGLVASIVPARHAARIQAVEALRAE